MNGNGKENTRLAGKNGKVDRSSELSDVWQAIKEQTERINALSSRLEGISQGHEQVQTTVRQEKDVLRFIEQDLQVNIEELQDALARRDFFTPKDAAYKLVVRRIREIVRDTLPDDRTLAIIGKPDRRLLNMPRHDGLCLPQTRDGKYTGYNPASSGVAIAQLEVLRSKGAEYLVIPSTSRWWLDHYQDFRLYLEKRFRLVVDEPEACVIYELHEAPGTRGSLKEIAQVLTEFEVRNGRRAAILDWNTNLELARSFPEDPIFAPSAPGHTLPYLDSSVDIVVFPSGASAEAEEAERVASAALIMVTPSDDRKQHEISIRWKSSTHEPRLPSTSIIIPCFNQIEYTERCLNALEETLPTDFRGEIIVVDDASTDDTPERLRRRAARYPFTVIRNRKNLGFVASCNKAAEAAKGEILLFLNNDTIPLPNWLPPLLDVFRERPDAGAAGGKLIYPEGRLQEAGGLVFRDGSAANFGRDDYKPDHPLYSYLREVDYCSGALFATKRALFKELGMFDERYKPAFYEDTDYCFKIREAGYRVYFQPESAVVHFEGATAGIDLSTGPKRYQVINEAKFIKRWASALEQQPVRPQDFDFATLHKLAKRGSQPGPGRALVCALMPEYDRDSGSRRILHLVESLQEGGWAVTFVSHHANAQSRYIRALQRRGVEVYCGDKQWMEQLIGTGNYGLAVFGLWDIAEPYIPVIRKMSPGTSIIVDSIDLHFLRNARRTFSQSNGSGAAAALQPDYGSAIVRELNTYAAADVVLTVSQKEADLINDLVAEPGLSSAVPDGEEIPASTLPLSERRGIVFVGCFRHTPNADAVAYLCNDILPRVKPELLARHPVYIVGDGMDENIRRLGAGLPHVKMVGWVPSVEPYLRQARISVVPLRYGAGTKRKLLQALMHGTPSVSTSIGTEGLNLQHGTHVLVADEAEAFAREMTALLENDHQWERLEQQGRAQMQAFHGRRTAGGRLNEVVRSALSKKVKRSSEAGTSQTSASSGAMTRDEYRELVNSIREVVIKHLPQAAGIAVVSKGDNNLLQLGERRAWHFPHDENGQYPGYYPANSNDAIRQLESLVSAGADHILFPKTAFWWLGHYKGLTDYLGQNFQLVVNQPDICSIYGLRNSNGNGNGSKRVTARETAVVAEPATAPEPSGASPAGAATTESTRLIAFFLPQYHPIPENDVWWGKGFTEWTNVANARPAFPGHYQPRLPADLGFYDLRLPEVRQSQADLAREYGLHGFCYYHYWFSGKQLLERPFNSILTSGEPDFPFCLCWANEPWSRRWDGRPSDVLQPQSYSDADDLAHIQWLLPALADKRAIRIDGKPVFIVYQGKELPNAQRTIDLWRSEAVKAGIGELYLMCCETGWDAGWDATRAGFDAKLLFQPQFAMLFNSGADIRVSTKQTLRVYDYQKAWQALANPEPVAYKRYDTVCVGWDNSARRANDAVVLHGSTPEAYESWLRQAIARVENDKPGHRIVFINAWNEWAEGCHLEPDQRHGHAHLEATKRALASKP